MSQPKLARKVSLPLLTFYGLGTILGAGIYVLIGEVTLRAGVLSPLAFFVSAVIAGITAYSFARLSSMYPKSAGEAAYALAAFKSKWISALVGLAVVLIGTVSAATMVRGFAGYFTTIASVPELLAMLSVVLFITTLSIWGIGQSLLAAALITIIEVLGLFFIIIVAIDIDQLSNYTLPTIETVSTNLPIIFFAAFISFYAYIGFEDIVNIAEETINPTRVIPLAILLSLIFSTLLYVILSVVCTVFVPPNIFEQSDAPLAAIVEYHGYNPTYMAAVSVVAIINGALVQQIMAARVLYGMAKQKLFLSLFATIHPITKTPIIATLFIGLLIIILATGLNLVTLAEITSAITLIIFIVVQASLLWITIQSEQRRNLDILLSVFGIFLNTLLLYFGLTQVQ